MLIKAHMQSHPAAAAAVPALCSLGHEHEGGCPIRLSTALHPVAQRPSHQGRSALSHELLLGVLTRL